MGARDGTYLRRLVAGVFLASALAQAADSDLPMHEIAPGVFVHEGRHAPWGEAANGDVANLGFIIGGAITVESVFSWPGLGQLTYQALRGPDVPLLQAIFLVLSVGVVVANLLADLLYGVLDPRVRTS